MINVDWAIYLFILNSLQETISNKHILNAFSTSHFPIFCSFIKCLNCMKGPLSVICNSNFVDEMKTYNTKVFLDQNDTFSNQSKWEF